MNKKNISLIFLISIAMALSFFQLKDSFKTHTFKGSQLPGQLGSIVADSKQVINSKEEGFLTYGPYIELFKGTYLFEIEYSSKNAEASKYDIVADGGKIVVKSGNLEFNKTATKMTQILKIKHSSIYEVRIYYAAKGELSLHSIKIIKQFGLKEIKKQTIYFLIALLLNTIIFYMYNYSKKITIFTMLLLFIVLATLVLETYTNYYKYKEMTYKEMPLSKEIFMFFFKQNIKSQITKLSADTFYEDHSMDTYYLMVDKTQTDKLNSDLPRSAMEQYVDARLKINDDLNTTKVKLRYRGGSEWNYSFERKSLKIKFSKEDSFHMDKVINLSKLYEPSLFTEPISQDLAKQVGILAPNVKVVKMFINGEYTGLYLYLEQIDESFLRKNRLMPGSIYSGDYSYNKPILTNEDGIPKLWYDSSLWEKKAARNAEQKNNTEDIELLIKAINTYTQQEFRDFTQIFFDDDYFKYLAFDVFTGTMHHDYYHNHKIYFDPYKGKFSPISWDIRFWMPDEIKDMSYYPLVEKIALDPVLDYKRDKELYKIINKITLQDIKNRINIEKEKIKLPLSFDKKPRLINANQTLFPYPECLYPQQLIVSNVNDIYKKYDTYYTHITQRVSYLKSLLNNTSVEYSKKENKSNFELTYKLSGNSPLLLDSPNKEILYTGRKLVKTKQVKSLAGDTKVIITPNTYTLTIPKHKYKKEYYESGTNAVTGKKIVFKKTTDLLVTKHLTQLTHTEKPLTLSGIIHITKTKVFKQEVVIKPNTTFHMDANTSLYFYKKVTAIGTKEKAIKFIPKDESKPWGLVAVQGKATSGSKFHYCHFENGSVDTRNLIHYTSQFNIHDTDNFEVKNCFIGKNHIGDDAMHIAYATGTVDSCLFDGARSDGLDIDISDVNITNNIFKNSGNDGLDVMTTTMRASNNTFIDAGDKGISVGENSSATITDSSFTRTLIGLEIKDKSKVTASNLTFKDSKNIDINLYNKNKRYNEGGFLKLTHPNSHPPSIKADKRSKVIKPKLQYNTKKE